MSDRWCIHLPDNHDQYPVWLNGLLEQFKADFTKEQFTDKVGDPELFDKLVKRSFIRPFVHPRDIDPFEKFRGEFYNPDHGLNLLTGFGPDPLTKSRGESLL